MSERSVEDLARRMEHGYDPEQLRPRRAGRPSLGEERQSPRIQLRVPHRLYATLSRQAREQGTTVSALVRQLLEERANRG